MNWVLAMALSSNPDGLYVRNFASEQDCVAEMRRLAEANQDNPIFNGIACINNEVKRDRG